MAVAADTCRWLLLVGEFDRRQAHVGLGFHCCSAWLAWRCSVAPRAAREQVRVARRLAGLPLVRKAFERGELSYSKVRALTKVEEPGVEADLLELARCATAAQLERIVRGFRGALDVQDARLALERRHFGHTWEDDGSLSFRGRLAPEEGRCCCARSRRGNGWPRTAHCPTRRAPPRHYRRALPPRRTSRRQAGRATPARRAAPRDRPPSGRASRADALVTMVESLLANGAASRGAGERHQVVVHIDVATLAGTAGHDADPRTDTAAQEAACATAPREEGQGTPRGTDTGEAGAGAPAPTGGPGKGQGAPPQAAGRAAAPGGESRAPDGTGASGPVARCCELEDGPALAAETARRLSCDGAVVPMLESADGTLHVGRRTRAIPPSIRRALRSRDRGCRFPGCPNHRWVEGHHIRHWAAGGETSLGNLVELCRRHHTLVHEQGYTVSREPDGALAFHTPGGAPIPNSPPLAPTVGSGRGAPRRPRARAGDASGPIPLPLDAGAPMDLHLAVAGLCDRARPEGPNGPLRRPDDRCRSPG